MPKNSPDFQFLLQFVNIHCKKGVPACIRPDREIKRIPVKEPSVKPLSKNELEEVRSYLRKDGYIRSQIEKAIQEATGNHIISARDRKGAPHLFEAGGRYIGSTFPGNKDFKKLFGMDSIKEGQYYCLLRVWTHCQRVFFALAKDSKDSKIIDELRHYIGGFPPGDNLFLSGIYSRLLEVLRLSINTKQCPCCGIFWTPGQARSKGRAREFCSGKCKNVFHMDGRAQNQEATQRARAGIKRHERQGDFRLVRDIYLLNGYPEGHSNRRANEWVFVKGKSYKQFLQRERSYKGEGLIINGL